MTARDDLRAPTIPAAARPGASWFYRSVRGLSRPAFAIWFRLRREGLAHVPADGPLILAANHVSYLDPAVLGSAFPRPVRFLMDAGIWGKPVLNWFFRGMRAIPVDRETQISRTALRASLDALARGEAIGIFPEGGRVDPAAMASALAGVALLARRSGAGVLPAGIVGTDAAMARGMAFPRPCRVVVRFGPALRYDALAWDGAAPRARTRDEAFTRELMERIRALASEGA